MTTVRGTATSTRGPAVSTSAAGGSKRLDKYTTWRENLITNSHIQQDYRERIDNGFEHPVDNH